jgi:hypothetical protein
MKLAKATLDHVTRCRVSRGQVWLGYGNQATEDTWGFSRTLVQYQKRLRQTFSKKAGTVLPMSFARLEHSKRGKMAKVAGDFHWYLAQGLAR